MRPSLINHAATNFAVLLAIAKQTPCAGRIIAVLTPITSPAEFASGPPEFPGFDAASAWIMLSIDRPDCACMELRSIDANNREISVWIVADQLSGKFPTIRNIDHEFACTMHDVAIGQNKTIWRDDESRTASAARSLCAPFDFYHGRRDSVDCADNGARVFVQQSD